MMPRRSPLRWDAAGVPSGPIYTAREMLEDPHFQSRDLIDYVPIEDGERFPMPGVIPKLSKGTGRVRWVGPLEVGSHNRRGLLVVARTQDRGNHIACRAGGHLTMLDTARPTEVMIVDVSPRDGLQNESRWVPTEQKIELVNRLARAGVPRIEVTSFVSPRAVPLMADAADVMRGIERRPGTEYCALVPNVRGFERALAAGADVINVVVVRHGDFQPSQRGNVGRRRHGRGE